MCLLLQVSFVLMIANVMSDNVAPHYFFNIGLYNGLVEINAEAAFLTTNEPVHIPILLTKD